MIKLSEIALLNPKIEKSNLDESSIASFVPMAAVSEVKGAVAWEEEREINQVLKGFTYFQSNDILVAKITPCFENGKIALASVKNEHAFGSTEFHVIRCNQEKADARYLFHFLRQKKIRIEGEKRMTGSGGQRRVPKAFLEELEIPLPPLEEQRRIAAILDKAEALRAKRREAITKLDLLLESTFIHFFGDPIKNPNKFHFLPLSKIISRDTINGAYYPKDKYVDNNGTPMVHMSDAFYDTVSTKGLKMVNIPKSEVDKYSIDDSDILIARRSLVYEGAAKPCRPKPEGKEMIFESSFIRVTPDKSIIDTAYLFNYLKNKCVRKNFILKFVTKSTISGINQKNLNMIEVMIPDIESQNKFRLMEEKINEKKILLKKQEFVFDNFIKSLNKSFFK